MGKEEGKKSEEVVEGLIPGKTMEWGHILQACLSVCLVKWTTRKRVRVGKGRRDLKENNLLYMHSRSHFQFAFLIYMYTLALSKALHTCMLLLTLQLHNLLLRDKQTTHGTSKMAKEIGYGFFKWFFYFSFHIHNSCPCPRSLNYL